MCSTPAVVRGLRGRLAHHGLTDLAANAPETGTTHASLVRSVVVPASCALDAVEYVYLAARLVRHRSAVVDIRKVDAVVRVCLRRHIA